MHIWRQRLHRWFEAPARRCPLSPNSITLLALLLNVAAAVTLAMALDRPQLFLAAPVLLVVGGLLDAFDGIVARVQNRSSRFGDFLDHVCDRASDAAILAGWTVGSGVRPAISLTAVVLVLLVGYVGTQIEASFGRRSYEGMGRGEFVLAFVTLPLVSYMIAVTQFDYRIATLSVAELLTIALALFSAVALYGRMKLAAKIADSEDGSPRPSTTATQDPLKPHE